MTRSTGTISLIRPRFRPGWPVICAGWRAGLSLGLSLGPGGGRRTGPSLTRARGSSITSRPGGVGGCSSGRIPRRRGRAGGLRSSSCRCARAHGPARPPNSTSSGSPLPCSPGTLATGVRGDLSGDGRVDMVDALVSGPGCRCDVRPAGLGFQRRWRGGSERCRSVGPGRGETDGRRAVSAPLPFALSFLLRRCSRAWRRVSPMPFRRPFPLSSLGPTRCGHAESGHRQHTLSGDRHLHRSAGRPVAAYQIEFRAISGRVKIVGIEGRARRFPLGPLLRPAAIQEWRVIIGALSTLALTLCRRPGRGSRGARDDRGARRNHSTS